MIDARNRMEPQSMETPTKLYPSLTRYLNSLTGRNLSDHTATAYRIDLAQFLTWLTENDISVNSPEKITRTHILDYLSHLAELGRSGVTRTRKLAAIREYCKFLVSEQLISSSPTEKIVRPKQERKQRVFLRVDEYMRLLNAAAGNSRDYAILQLFLQTGIRVAELVGLQLSDIDLEAGTMLINGKGNKQRTIYLEKEAAKDYASLDEELEELETLWPEYDFEKRRTLINFAIREVVIDSMSTHWLRIQVLWLHEGWGREEMFYHRRRGKNKEWTGEEKKILAEYYLSLPTVQLMALLPDRTWKSILSLGARTISGRRNIGNRGEETPPPWSRHYSHSDLAFMREHNLEGNIPCTNWTGRSERRAGSWGW